MMLRSNTSCFRCQKGGNPAKLTVGRKRREEERRYNKFVTDKKFHSTLVLKEGGRRGEERGSEEVEEYGKERERK